MVETLVEQLLLHVHSGNQSFFATNILEIFVRVIGESPLKSEGR